MSCIRSVYHSSVIQCRCMDHTADITTNKQSYIYKENASESEARLSYDHEASDLVVSVVRLLVVQSVHAAVFVDLGSIHGLGKTSRIKQTSYSMHNIEMLTG